MGFPLYVTCCFSLAAFNILSLYLVFVSLISMCLGMFLLGLILYGILYLLDWIDYFLFRAGEIFSYILFKKNLSCPFFFYSSETPIIRILVHLIFSQRSLRLSPVLFILFTLFCSSEVISTILSSSSLICSSASDILLLILSRLFWRRKWQPTPVFLPGESHGRRSLVGCSPWGRTESDTTEAT